MAGMSTQIDRVESGENRLPRDLGSCEPGTTMYSLPAGDPGTPDTRGPLRYLWWVARVQGRRLVIGIAFAIVWWLGQALVPAALGKGIDALDAKDVGLLARWSAVVLGLGVLQAAAGTFR